MVRREKNKGITLIALIIIIIVLLILASITISSLTGDNGIINRAIQAKELTEKAQIEEQIELQVMETIAEEGEFDSEKFKENVEENLGEYNPQITENEDTITVTIEETEVNIDKETGEIIGTVPKVEINVYDKEGNPVDIEEVIEDEVVITIEVTNKEELDEIEIIVKDENGEIIEKDTEITGEGDESYTIPGEGEYTITITGIKDGKEETIEKVITIGNKEEAIDAEIKFSPNGGEYVMPTTGKATISTRIEANSTSGKEYTYYYAWGEDNTTEPTEWIPTTSSEKISKTDCKEGSYYLWIKIEGESQEEVTVSNEFKVNSNSNQNSQITLTPDKTEATNGDITVTVTYGDILTEGRTLECTGEEGIDYVREGTDKIIVKTNGQTVTATAKDEAGNIVTKSYTVNNIDKIEPSTTAPTATATTNSVTVNFAQTDNGSGVNSSTIQYSIKKTTESEWGEWITDTNTTHTFTGLELGTSYDVRTQVKDTAGNGYTISSTKTITTVDITKPTFTLSDSKWTNQNITVTITYPEIEGITKQYSYDNQKWETYTGPLTIDSNKTIYARSIDSTNQGSDTTRVASTTITTIDKELPIMNSLTANTSSASKENVTLTGKAIDKLSGIIAYQFSTNGNLNVNSPGWTTIERTTEEITQTYEAQTNATYYFYVKDTAGNINKNSIEVNNIDKTAPQITTATTNTTWSNTNKAITITATDEGGSGISGYGITTTNTEPTEWKASTSETWTSEAIYGNGTYYTWVKDGAGNVSTSKTVTVNNIEGEAPTISVNSNGTPAKAQTATITIGDTKSGLAGGTYTIKYTWTTTETEPNWEEVTTTKNITVTAGAKTGTTEVSKSDGTGTYYLHVQGQNLRDQAGNTATPVAYGIFRLTNEGPTINFGTNGSTTYKKEQSTTITIPTTEGIQIDENSLKYQWTQSTTPPEENTFTEKFDNGETIRKDTGTGIWYLWILAKDNLGNTTITHSNPFYIDNTSPTNTAPTATGTTNTIVVNFTQTDGESGINSTSKQYSIKKHGETEWGEWITDENTSHIFSGLELGTQYDVRTQVKDTAGNGYTISETYTIETIDITKPTIIVPNTKWTNKNIEVTIEYPEIEGITKQYSYDNIKWETYTKPLIIDKNTTIYARSIDSTNQGTDNTRVATVEIGNIDKELPEINSYTSNEGGATQENITLTGKAIDRLSGIVAYQFSTNGELTAESAGWTTIEETTEEITQTNTVQENGTYYFYVKDGAGNINKKSIQVGAIDKIAPKVLTAETNTNWSNKNKAITITAVDEESGIAGYAITETNVEPNSWNNSSENTWTSEAIYGNGTYYTWVKDGAGNVSTSKTVTVNNIEGEAPTISVNSNGTPAKAQTATITIGDTKSGLAGGTYTIKYTWTTTETEPNWEEVTTTKNITVTAGAKTGTTEVSKSDGTGTYYLHVQGQNLRDQAGNTATPVAYGTFKIDNQGPTISYGTNGNTTYKKTQSTTVTVTDNGGSTVNTESLKYQWLQTTTQPQESSFTSTFENKGTVSKSDGTGDNWYLWIIAKDNLGNTTITKSNAFYLDNTAPSTTAPTTTATTNTITVTPKQTDNNSGINKSTYQYSIKKTTESTWGGWVTDTNTTHTFTGLSLNTSYDIRTQVKDISGNGYTISSTKTITTVNITKPTINVPNTGWTNQNITVTIAYPEIQGITKQYSYNNSTWQTYTGPLTIDSNKTIYARSIDSTNQGSDTTRVASTTITTIDKELPTMNSLTSGNSGATKNNITLTGKAIDKLSGIIAYQFSTNNNLNANSAGWTTITRTTTEITQTYEVQTNGTYYFYVKDSAGNINKTSIQINNIDKQAPTITSVTSPTNWTNTNKTITITATDEGGSGIAGYGITTTNTAPTEWEASTSGTWTSKAIYGNGTYYTWVKDGAGNVSTSKTVTVNNIEGEAPTISVNSNGTPAKAQTATITIGDTKSGLAGGTYTIKYTWTTSGVEPNWSSISTTKTIQVTAGAKTGTTTVSKADGTGTYYLHVQVANLKDQAGNTTTPTAYGTFKLDNQGPTISFGTNGSTTYKKTQSTTVKVTDNGGSTVNTGSLKYQWLQTTTKPGESSFSSTFENEGTVSKSDGTGNNWYLWILAKDNLGNTTITKSNAFYLDNTAPNTTAPTATATTNTITVNFAQTDSHSGISSSSKQYSIKKTTDSSWGSWVTDTNTSHTFTGLTLNTSYEVRTQVKDTAGNGYTISSTKTITTTNITKPTFTLSNSKWTNQNITLTINYPNVTGITKQYSYNNSTWQTYTGPLTIDSNKTVYARSIDSTNQGTDNTRVASVTIGNIDKNKPVITNLTATPKTMTITATDSLSGIVGYAYSKTSSKPSEYTSITSTKNFNTTIEDVNINTTYYIWLKDAAGNEISGNVITKDMKIINGIVDDLGTRSTVYLYRNPDFYTEAVGEQGIDITMPNGSEVNYEGLYSDQYLYASDTVIYEITRNGTYTFTAKAGEDISETTIQINNIQKFSPIEQVGTVLNTNAYSYKGAVVPKGYYVDTNSNVDTGLVITDEIDNEGYSTGNEWVWVPVNSTVGNDDYYIEKGGNFAAAPSVSYKRYAKLYSFSQPNTRDPYGTFDPKNPYESGYQEYLHILGSPSIDDAYGYYSGFREPDIPHADNDYIDKENGELYKYNLINKRGTNGEKCTSVEDVVRQYGNDFYNMTESVDKYGGFYIGRYELTENGEKTGKPITEKTWYDLYNASMQFDSEYVTSGIIWGSLWDATMQWLLTRGYTIGYTGDVSQYGNYIGNAVKISDENITIMLKA